MERYTEKVKEALILAAEAAEETGSRSELPWVTGGIYCFPQVPSPLGMGWGRAMAHTQPLGQPSNLNLNL